MKASSENGSTLDIRIDKIDGPLIALIEIPKNTDWGVVNSALMEIPSDIHNLIVLLNETNNLEIDWISFE